MSFLKKEWERSHGVALGMTWDEAVAAQNKGQVNGRFPNQELQRLVNDVSSGDGRSIPSKPGHNRGNSDANGTGKQSNPKDVIGSTKLPLSVVPWTLMVCATAGHLEGAIKYGRFNWRIAGVRASIYLDALKRHVAKWENGQDHDKKSQVHHLDNAITSLSIMRDAMLYGKFIDDRPPCPNPDVMAELIDAGGEIVAHLKATFADHNPYHFTIEDTPR